MRKIVIITAAVLVLALVTGSAAMANGGPHGGYTATTDGCAGCHRAHTATAAGLLMVSGTYELCWSCHSNTGLGANTNVEDGYYLSSRDDAGGDYDHGVNTGDNSPLLGGGFANYRGVPVTSLHEVDPTVASDQAWGNGVARGSAATLVDGIIDCASCHDPHGSPNYRIMHVSVNSSVVAIAQVDEGTEKDYGTEQWGAGTSTICVACHGAYHVTRSGSGSDNSDVGENLDYGGDVSTFAHRVDMSYAWGGNTNPEDGWTDPYGDGPYYLPLGESGDGDNVVCMTCHFPHGTPASMTLLAEGPYTNDSALLRLDNRGVCEVCHQK